MKKKVYHIFVVVCILLSMSATTAFAAPTDIEKASITTAAKSGTKTKTFNYSIYENEVFILGVKAYVTGYYDGSPYHMNSRITDIYIEYSGPMASECEYNTNVTYPIAITSITTNKSKLLAILDYSIDNKGNIKGNIKRYVK